MDSPKTFELADAGAAPAAAFVPLLVNPIVTFTTTAGVIQCELYLDECPITVSNFVDLAESGFYNGLHFHRVIASFMCQFGCPYASDPADARAGSGGPDFGSSFTNLVDGSTISRTGGNIPDEFTAKIRNDAGTLSMANTGAPNSGGSQMFMNVNDNNQLNWYTPGESKHPVFGKCVDAESFNVMVAISELPTQNDRPAAPVKVTSVQIGLPSAAAATGPATATVAEPTQPSPAAEATQPIPAAEATQPSPSIPAGISWADKESKDWKNQDVWQKNPMQAYMQSMVDPGSTLSPGPVRTPETPETQTPEEQKTAAQPKSVEQDLGERLGKAAGGMFASLFKSNE